MKKIYLILVIIFCSFSTSSQEPFVVLENSKTNYTTSSKIDMYNPFLKDSNQSWEGFPYDLVFIEIMCIKSG